MRFVADLHIHSRYARGTSPRLGLQALVAGAQRKGIDLLATGDCTHPTWLAELEEELVEVDGGLLRLRSGAGPRLVLGGELSCVYGQGGRTRRVHLLVFAPSFEAVRRLSSALAPYGALRSDGRPTLALSCRDTVELVLSADERCEVLPAHAWTPWFGALGSRGGFDGLEECFLDLFPHIHAVETGLSSDPAMNWRVPELDDLAIVSFSDAHSPERLAREATVFDGDLTYDGLRSALAAQQVAYTIEFYAEEGKYHLDGHRRCGVVCAPGDPAWRDGRCPVCARPLTRGVAHRIEEAAGLPSRVHQREDGLMEDPAGRRPAFRRLVPLGQVLGAALGVGAGSRRVGAMADRLVAALGPELQILEHAALEDLSRLAGERVAEAVARVRHGELTVTPGYDGVYGTVRIWPEEGRSQPRGRA